MMMMMMLMIMVTILNKTCSAPRITGDLGRGGRQNPGSPFKTFRTRNHEHVLSRDMCLLAWSWVMG